jgi:uncharacterized PurR-regulated membrane protein YhhQ (DUF165 family)
METDRCQLTRLITLNSHHPIYYVFNGRVRSGSIFTFSFAVLHHNITVALFGRDIALFMPFLGLIAAALLSCVKLKH